MDVSIIIVSYNTYALTRDAVQSCYEEGSDLDLEIIVVDNNSPDESAQKLEEYFASSTQKIRVIKNKENKGFSAANNQGVSLATGDTLFFLNPDTLVHPKAIGILTSFIRNHPDAGAVGPRVLNPDRTIQVSTGQFMSPTKLLNYHFPIFNRFFSSTGSAEAPTVVDVVKGCALMIKSEAFKKAGGWDEGYFMYSEETELCLSLHKMGYKNFIVPGAVITHFGGQSSLENYAEQQVIQQRSALQFLQKHHEPYLSLINRVGGIVGFGLRAIIFPVLRILVPGRSANYALRGNAASRLFRWFLFDYS